MVAIDDKHNGYRHLILPIARTDEIVRNAVVTVSAFHISVQRQHSNWSPESVTQPPFHMLSATEGNLQPEQLYSRTIARLLQYQDLSLCDVPTRRSVLLAILTLMIGVMVTGSDDFPILYRLLEYGLGSMGGESGLGIGDVPDFMVRQIRKYVHDNRYTTRNPANFTEYGSTRPHFSVKRPVWQSSHQKSKVASL